MAALSLPITFYRLNEDAKFIESLKYMLDMGAFAGDFLIRFGSALSFLKDDEFTDCLAKHPDGQAMALAWRLHVACWAAKSALGLEGDFVECGVQTAITSTMITSYLNFASVDKRFYLYDSFDGIPQEYLERQDEFASDFGVDVDATNQDEYRNTGNFETVSRRFSGYPNVNLVKGPLPATFEETCPEKIAFLHMDLANFPSERDTLEYLIDRMVDGGVVLFQGFGLKHYGIFNLAKEPFITERNLSILELPTGQGLMICHSGPQAEGAGRRDEGVSNGSPVAALRPPATFYGFNDDAKFVEGLKYMVEQGAFAGDLLIRFGSALTFLQDDRFTDCLAKHPENGAKSLAWRLHTACWAAKNALALEGDFVECGVQRAVTSTMITSYLDFASVDKRFYLYDSFDGIPQEYLDRQGEYARDFGIDVAAMNSEGWRAPDNFETVSRRFADYPNVSLVKGPLPETFEETCPERIAFLHMDLSNFPSERDALKFLIDRMVDGGIVLFQGFGLSHYGISNLAKEAFIRERNLPIVELPTGQGLMICRSRAKG